MSPAARTFWRRFFLLDPKTEWTARELKRQPELSHISPQDPYFAPQRGVAGYFRRLREGLPHLRLTIAIQAAFALLVGGLLSVLLTPALLSTPNGLSFIFNVLLGLALLECVAVSGLGFWYAFRSERTRRQALRTELRRRGIPICVHCGSEDADLSAPRCPECGAVRPVAAPGAVV